ncbi:transcriptional regulator BetI [Roseovarius albus]|uniref:Transcriptional regulator BetI n=1 Tax=Roseovarius albus TaxID=1247867 RepID=A0A1X7A9W5_9RHOB|nr:TetR/AcrR family transcriptional regulator [Roseovarius albus]SLN73927.1 transcriptional regulator BetI [Roseovarius albus]
MNKNELKQSASDEPLSAKGQMILEAALKLLIETGDAGLTMRKLAESAGMRLSNVQYYFKTRDDVLTAMITRYFDDCTQDLVRLTQESEAATPRERVLFLIRAGLAHGQDISDMCRSFREIWAISSRNAIIDTCLMDYYRGFANVLADFALPQGIDERSRARMKSLLVPYFEGYSITARSLPLGAADTAEMLTDLAMSVTSQSEST